MVNGARTIKCYGWENFILDKLVAAAIVVPTWAQGKYLDPGVNMAVLGMVFFIFASINMTCYFAMTFTQ